MCRHAIAVRGGIRQNAIRLEPEIGETGVRDLPLFCGFRVRRVEIRVKDLHRHVQLFGFIPGYPPFVRKQFQTTVTEVRNISPYLVAGGDVVLRRGFDRFWARRS